MNPSNPSLLDRLVRRLLLQRRQRLDPTGGASRRAFLRTAVLGAATVQVAGPAILNHLARPVELMSGEAWQIAMLKGVLESDRLTYKMWAEWMATPILQVIEQAPCISDLYKTVPLGDSLFSPSPSIPLDLSLDDDLVEDRLFTSLI